MDVLWFHQGKRLSVLFFFLCFSLVSCLSKQDSIDTLFVILDAKPNTLDPRTATSANGMRLVPLMFNGFVRFDDKGELQPDIALKWELEGLTWTFYLKRGVRFSNGRAVGKEDILFSFEEFKKKESPFHSAFKKYSVCKGCRKKSGQ